MGTKISYLDDTPISDAERIKRERRDQTMSEPEGSVHLGSDFDSCPSSEEELECLIGYEERHDSCCGVGVRQVQEESALDGLAKTCKIVLFAFVPMIGRQLGSFLSRRILTRLFGRPAY